LLNRGLSIARKFGLQEIEGGCLDSLAVIALREGDFQRANELFQSCLTIWDALENRWWQATDLICLSHVARSRGYFSEVVQYAAQGSAIFKELGSPWGIASALCAQGASARELKDNEKARSFCRESLVQSERIGWRSGTARAHLGLSQIAYFQGEYEEALERCQSSHSIFTELGKIVEIPTALSILGRIHHAMGDFQASEHCFWDALRAALAIRSPFEILRALVGLAPTLSKDGEVSKAVHLLRYAIAHPAAKALDREKAEELLSSLTSDQIQDVLADETSDFERLEITEIAAQILADRPPD
jgi:tetratricopeptide (TPR) repeat protein